MSIDKESNGLPEVNVHRRATKVNLCIVVAILFFFAVMAGIAFWVSSEAKDPAPSASATIESGPLAKP
jgi:hypothetical protein